MEHMKNTGFLRCYKCCSYYHFAKDCIKEETCGVVCAGKYVTKMCKSEKIERIKLVFKTKNLNSDHLAFNTDCPCYKREIENQKSRMHNSLN